MIIHYIKNDKYDKNDKNEKKVASKDLTVNLKLFEKHQQHQEEIRLMKRVIIFRCLA